MPTYIRFRTSDGIALHMHPTNRNPQGRWHGAWERHPGDDNAHLREDAIHPTLITSGRWQSHYDVERAMRLGQMSIGQWEMYLSSLNGRRLVEPRRQVRRSVFPAGLRRGEEVARVSTLFPPMEEVEGDPWFQPVSTRKFGIEIECITDVNEVARLFREAHIPLQVESRRLERAPAAWAFKGDGSLHYSGNKPNFRTAELVSPPLSGEAGIRQLKAVCSILNQVGTLVNKSCGLHIHHDAGDFNIHHTRRLALTYYNSQVQIDKFLAISRRSTAGATYCKPFSAQEARSITSAISHSDFPNDRYRNLNIAPAFRAHGTYEFRQHQGTVDFLKIVSWLKFGQALMKFALTDHLPLQPVSVQDLMLSLGMPGEAGAFLISRADSLNKRVGEETPAREEATATANFNQDLFTQDAEGRMVPRVGGRQQGRTQAMEQIREGMDYSLGRPSREQAARIARLRAERHVEAAARARQLLDDDLLR